MRTRISLAAAFLVPWAGCCTAKDSGALGVRRGLATGTADVVVAPAAPAGRPHRREESAWEAPGLAAGSPRPWGAPGPSQGRGQTPSGPDAGANNADPRATLEAAAQHVAPRVLGCVQAFYRSQAPPPGPVAFEVAFTLSMGGRVNRADVTSAQLRDGATLGCVQRVVASAQFPPQSTTGVTFRTTYQARWVASSDGGDAGAAGGAPR